MLQRPFLAAIVLCTGLAFAAPKVEVRLQGVDGELEQNVLAHLSIVRELSDPEPVTAVGSTDSNSELSLIHI